MPKGFFKDDFSLDTIVRGDEVVNPVKQSSINYSCIDCGLHTSCNTPKMKVSGKGRLGILLVGEFPGEEDDRNGVHFSGKSGALLRGIIKNLGYDLDKDFWSTSALICHPEKAPSALQIAACRKNLAKTIEELNPLVVIPFGKMAMDSLVSQRMTGRLSGLSLVDWAGCSIPDQELKRYICPTWQLFMLFRMNDKEDYILKSQMSSHIRNAISIIEDHRPFYQADYLSECIAIYDVQEAIKILLKMMDRDVIAFDYETTGKKPHRNGHKIFSVSVSDGLFGYAFPYFNDKKFRMVWNDLLASDVKKVAHNAKFEVSWTMERAGFNDTKAPYPNNIYWDTMLAAHVLDNKKKTNLKFQLYSLLGIAGYDSAIETYIQAPISEEEVFGANAFNKIEQAPLDLLLKYNAMDSLGTYKLYEYQRSKITPEMKKGLFLFVKGSMALVKAEDAGIRFNENSAEKNIKRLTKEMNFLESQVLSSKEMKKWDKPTPFRMSAPQDLPYLLFNKLGHKVNSITKTGKPKSDKDSLEKFNIPIVQDVLEWRKWQKVKDTYLKGFTRESVDGFIHPLFNLHKVNTYRSSSDSPNFQNIPKRDAEISKILRDLLVPRPGNKLGEYDYRAMEVALIACYNKDPTLIKFIENGFDMHRDIASQLFLRNPEEVTKKERYVAKNGFVFPTFYGSYFENSGPQIWESIEASTKEHLKEKGVKNLNDFIDLVKSVEDDFWGNRFPVAYEYKERSVANYDKKGYVDLFTGFRCYGPMTRNQILNYPVQGTAFHCLLWTFMNVTNYLEKNSMNTKLIGQIHDAIIPDIDPAEEKELDRVIWLYGTQKIREYWPQIIVPLGIEKSISEVDGAWSKMTEIGILSGE